MLLTAACAPSDGTVAPGDSASAYSTTLPSGQPRATNPVQLVEGDILFPVDSLEDWVTYGDFVIVATVSGDQILTEPKRSVDIGIELTGRLAAFDRLEVLFHRRGAPAVPADLRALVPGAVRSDGVWKPLAVSGQPRIEPGGRYLLAITFRPDYPDVGDGGMQIIGAMPAEGGIAGEGEWAGRGERRTLSAAQDQLLGLDLDEVETLLRQTRPDPYAAPYSDLAPVERWAKASEDREGAATPEPRPS